MLEKRIPKSHLQSLVQILTQRQIQRQFQRKRKKKKKKKSYTIQPLTARGAFIPTLPGLGREFIQKMTEFAKELGHPSFPASTLSQW